MSIHVDVIIPTLDREDTLKETIKSALASSYKRIGITVVIDGNFQLARSLAGWPVKIILNAQRRDWVVSMNKAIAMTHDSAVLYASDDLVFDKYCIERAVQKMPKDQDALVAIKQDVKGCRTAFGLLGRKFIERFPKSQVFCPDYIHFGSDFEIGLYAARVNKLVMCPEARVQHRRLHDATHQVAVKVKERDVKIKQERKNRGYLWGLNFDRLMK